MEPIVDVNGQTFYRCQYSHGLLNDNPIDALFPSKADAEAHVADKATAALGLALGTIEAWLKEES